jgi:hypothetical protein
MASKNDRGVQGLDKEEQDRVAKQDTRAPAGEGLANEVVGDKPPPRTGGDGVGRTGVPREQPAT